MPASAFDTVRLLSHIMALGENGVWKLRNSAASCWLCPSPRSKIVCACARMLDMHVGFEPVECSLGRLDAALYHKGRLLESVRRCGG